MLKISDFELRHEAKARGYRPEMLEKVYHLLHLLEEFMSVDYLSARLALKGGTAINLFCTDEFPRLSVDLDFNYVGSADRQIMLQEKPELEAILLDICKRRQYELHRNPKTHAGGKTVLVYQSLLGTKGRLEIDLNYVYRVPLWETKWGTSPDWPKATNAKILDIHELAAGKLNALLDRDVSRDLFDSHRLLTKWPLNMEQLRLAFTVYAGMRKHPWEQINVERVKFSVKDIRDKLIPVLKNTEAPDMRFPATKKWATNLLDECKMALAAILPFRMNEIEFLEQLQKQGEIRMDLLSDDPGFCKRVSQYPLLHWRKLQR